MAREAKVIIRLDEDVKERLQENADKRGMTMSALGSYILGSWLLEEEHKKQMQLEVALAMKDKIISAVVDMEKLPIKQ